VAAALVSRRAVAWRRWNRVVAVVCVLEEGSATPTKLLCRVARWLAIELFAGLVYEGTSRVRMLLTCVDAFPDR
jgi:hexokinase